MGALIGLLFGVGVVSIWLAIADNGHSSSTVRLRDAVPRRRLIVAASAGVAGLLALTLTGLPFVGILAMITGAFVPGAVRKRRDRRIRAQRAHAWPEVIDSLVSAVRAGMSLPEAIAAIGQRGPEQLRAEFVMFADDYRTTGQFETAIGALRSRLADPVADRVCEAMLIARDVGGTDLGRMLRTLGDFVRQDLRLRDEAAARRSWTVNGARLAIAAPWIVLVMLSTQPDVVSAYRTAGGVVVLSVAAGICVVAYWLMSRLGELSEPRRIAV